ncbi:MAG: cyclic nucleotide-binding domain-containing protein [Betaproteobacteria bacterium]
MNQVSDTAVAGDPGLLAFLGATPPFDRLPLAALEAALRQMTPLTLAAGETLLRSADPGEAMYVVLEGALAVRQEGATSHIGPGGLVGEMQILVGGRHGATVDAVSRARLLRLEKAALEQLAREVPQLVVSLGELVRRRLQQEQLRRVLSSVFGELDADSLGRMQSELEWVELRAGEALFEQGAASDCLYLVVSGRLLGVHDDAGNRRVVAEIGRGETIGEMGFFTGETRSAGIYARRASQLVRFSRPVFDRLSQEHPRAMLYITQLLIRRLRRASGFVRETFDRCNVVVLPLAAGAGAAAFTGRLVEALRVHGRTLYASAERLDAFIGVPDFSQTPPGSPLDLALDAGLEQRESDHRYAVYECDPSDTPWTRRCLERADRILLVADASADCAPAPVEQALLGERRDLIAARRMLVLLHAAQAALPAGTRHWLAARKVDSHHHLRRDSDADFARLARFLSGNAIGVVLGGGGARGFAHLGAIRALREAGIPIDMIGGTSMGALIAVQPALGWDDDKMLEANRRAFVERKPVALRDYTVPVYALVGGNRLDQSLMAPLGETCIEDLWTGYFCVSSNLTRAEPRVHRAGPVWKAIRASLSLPGVFQPVVEDSDLLVDGGVLNNLPGDVMRELGGGWVIAVDVSPGRDLELRRKELPSPWKVLLDWCNPFAKPANLPTIANLMMRTTLLASVGKTESVKKLVDLYIQPPVSPFGLMQFRALEAIAETGYRHAKPALEAWLRSRPDLAQMLQPVEPTSASGTSPR